MMMLSLAAKARNLTISKSSSKSKELEKEENAMERDLNMSMSESTLNPEWHSLRSVEVESAEIKRTSITRRFQTTRSASTPMSFDDSYRWGQQQDLLTGTEHLKESRVPTRKVTAAESHDTDSDKQMTASASLTSLVNRERKHRAHVLKRVKSTPTEASEQDIGKQVKTDLPIQIHAAAEDLNSEALTSSDTSVAGRISDSPSQSPRKRTISLHKDTLETIFGEQTRPDALQFVIGPKKSLPDMPLRRAL
jgi:hypothetical protein